MSAELETRLRDMLRTRATDIDTLPERLMRFDEPIRLDTVCHRPHRRRWLLAAAAAALIVAVTGAVVGIRQLGAHHERPAGPNTVTPSNAPTSPSTSPSTSTSTHAAGVPLACQATLPDAWKAAMNGNSSAYGAQSATVMAAAPNGDIVVARDFGWDQPRDLILIQNGAAPRTVFEVNDPNTLDIEDAFLAGQQLVVSVGVHPRFHEKGAIPGSSTMPNVVGLYVVNLRTGAQQQIASTPQTSGPDDPAIDWAALLDGSVYWDLLPNYGSATGVLKSYDLSSGRTRTVFSGDVRMFRSSLAGIESLDDVVIVRGQLPPAVTSALDPKYPLHVGTDGTAYAWLSDRDVIAWWTPGQRHPTYLRLPHRITIPAYPDGFLVVSGHYVVVGGQKLLDMRTGAVASVPQGPQRDVAGLAAGHTVFGSVSVGSEHFDSNGYIVEPSAQVFSYDTTALPDLHC